MESESGPFLDSSPFEWGLYGVLCQSGEGRGLEVSSGSTFGILRDSTVCMMTVVLRAAPHHCIELPRSLANDPITIDFPETRSTVPGIPIPGT